MSSTGAPRGNRCGIYGSLVSSAGAKPVPSSSLQHAGGAAPIKAGVDDGVPGEDPFKDLPPGSYHCRAPAQPAATAAAGSNPNPTRAFAAPAAPVAATLGGSAGNAWVSSSSVKPLPPMLPGKVSGVAQIEEEELGDRDAADEGSGSEDPIMSRPTRPVHSRAPAQSAAPSAAATGLKSSAAGAPVVSLLSSAASAPPLAAGLGVPKKGPLSTLSRKQPARRRSRTKYAF